MPLPENFTVKRWMSEMQSKYSDEALGEVLEALLDKAMECLDHDDEMLQERSSVKLHSLPQRLNTRLDDVVRALPQDEKDVLVKLVIARALLDLYKAALKARAEARGEVLKRYMDTRVIEASGRVRKAIVMVGTLMSSQEFKLLYQAKLGRRYAKLREAEQDLERGVREYESAEQTLARTTQAAQTTIQRTGTSMVRTV